MKVLLLSDIWPNRILGCYAAHEKEQGNEVYKSLEECEFPDKIIASWNIQKLKFKQPILEKYNGNYIEGGPAVDIHKKAPDHIAHRMPDYDFLGIDYALGRLSVGCPHKCPWCYEWKMWGTKIKPYDDLDTFLPENFNKVMLLDPNFTKYKRATELLNDFRERDLKVCFQSGWSAKDTTEKIAEALSSVNYQNRNFKTKGIYIAFDNIKDEAKIKKGIEILKAHKIKIELCYTLTGFPHGDEIGDIFYRVLRLLEWGVDPYVMPYHNNQGMIANVNTRRFKRMINLRFYRKLVKEHGPEKGLKKACELYEYKIELPESEYKGD